ncbi:MAG: DUF6414 family protein [Thermomicrobiales bacterium]
MSDTQEQPPSVPIRDLIYFDAGKAASLFSQIDEGLLQDIKESVENARGRKASGGLQAGPVRADLGRDSQDRNTVTESRIPHHHLLALLEEYLQDKQQLLDVNQVIGPDVQMSDYSDESIRCLIKHPAFITAEGRAEFFDYRRFGDMLPRLNEVMDAYNEMASENYKQSSEYQQAQSEISRLKLLVREMKEEKQRVVARATLSALENQIKDRIEDLAKNNQIPPHMIKLLTSFTTTMLPNRLDLKIRPYERNRRFRVLANLKRECFLDADIENILFSYGMKPDVPLTIFGLTTSIPPKEDDAPALSQVLSSSPGSQEGFERMFDGLQGVFEGLGQFTRFSYYPNITVYPIAVYQRLGSLLPEGEGEAIPDVDETET